MAFDFAYVKTRVFQGVLRDDLTAQYGDFVNEALREIQNRRSWTWMKGTTFVTVNPGVQAAGGNLVPQGSVWPTGSGTLSFSITGFAIGARYFLNQGNSSGISADGISLLQIPDGFFTATQASYTLLAPAASSALLITASVLPAGIDQVAALPSNFKELQRWRPIHYVTDDGQFIPTDVVFDFQQYFRIWAFGGTPITTWPPRAYMERRGNGVTVIGIVEPLTSQFNFRVGYYGFTPDLVNDADTHTAITQYPEMVINLAKAIAFASINDPAEAEFRSDYEDKIVQAIRADAYSEDRGRELRM